MRRLGLIVLAGTALLLGSNLAVAASDNDSDNKFSLHGEVRFRGEFFSNLTDFTDTENTTNSFDDDFDLFPYRVRLAAKGDLGHDIWVYGEFQGDGVAGGGGEENVPIRPFFGDPSAGNRINNVDLYQGWVRWKDVGRTVLDLTFGRQEIVFDTGLHFSSLPFYNGITHDSIVAEWQWDDFGITGFWTRPNENNLTDPSASTDNNIGGVHFKHDVSRGRRGVEEDVAYYVFVMTQNADTILEQDGDERGDIITVGGRWGRKIHDRSGFDWNIEAAFQTGDYAPCAPPTQPFFATTGAIPTAFGTNCTPGVKDEALDLSATVVEATGGYNWHAGSHTQRVWGQFTLATGDQDPNDGDEDAYIPLFTDFHSRLGKADQYALSNIQAFAVGYEASVEDGKHTFGASVWQFTKDEQEGTNFSPLTGTFIDCDAGFPGSSFPLETCDDDLGLEYDLFYNLRVSNNFSIDAALSVLDPGDAVEQKFNGFGTTTNGSDTGWRLTAQARARF
ncbi:MAG: alginate export family protein [Acidobacteriota bacterium]